MSVTLLLMASEIAETGEPVDRNVAIAGASAFDEHIEAALTAPTADLYSDALNGNAENIWRYGLSLISERYNLDAMPETQRSLYIDYIRRAEADKEAYVKKHPKAETGDMTLDEFSKPTPDEVQAIRLANMINNPDYWLERAGRIRNTDGSPLIERVLITQSRKCLEAVKGDIDSQDMMSQLIHGLSKNTGGDGDADMSAIMAELSSADPDYETLNNQALCGGATAYQHYKVLMKQVYKPSTKITIETER